MGLTRSDNLIVEWTRRTGSDIAPYPERHVLEPEPIYPGWMNLISQRSIRAIAIAPISRHIWMATWGGVLSWRQRDETTYYRYSSEHGLAGNGVSCVCVDSNERPWVGHDEGGLGYFENNRWNIYSEWRKEIFRSVKKAESGGIWAATDNTLYRVFGPEQASVPTPITQSYAQYPKVLLADADDLLLGNNQGLFRLGAAGELERIEPEKLKSCVSLTRDAQGRIWIATTTEIYLMDSGQLQPEQFYDQNDGYIRQIEAGRNVVWVLTTNGLSLIDKTWKPISLIDGDQNAPDVATIAVSSSDYHLWLGTSSLLSSLYYAGDGSATVEHSLLPEHKEDQLNNVARCLAGSHDDQTVWIGTAEGVVRFHADDTWSIVAGTGDVRDLCQTSDANVQALWLLHWPKGFQALSFDHEQPPGIPIRLVKGTDGKPYGLTTRGLWCLGASMKQIADAPPRRALSITQSQDGTWWAGTSHGVYREMNGSWSPANEQPGPGLSEVYALVALDDEAWVAAANGLWCRNGKQWKSHNHPELRIVRAIGVSSDKQKLWLAQQDGIVRYVPEDQSIDRFYSLEGHGIASLRINAIAEFRGDLWIATAAGTSRLRLAEEVI